MKKIMLCGFILLCLALLLPHEASAVETSGTCGENLTWEYDAGSCTLRISGTGPMDDWPSGTVPPWKELLNWSAQLVKHIEIGEGVTTVGECAFFACPVESVTLPSTLVSIHRDAFSSCYDLRQIDLPESLMHIGPSAFSGCRLKEVQLPSHLQTIGYHAFRLGEFTKLTIPASVTEIKYGIVWGCEYVSLIEFAGDAPVFNGRVFDGFSGTVIYPAGNETWTEAVRQQYGGEVAWYPSNEVLAEGAWERNGYTWRLENGTLYINGNGYMYGGWISPENPPWYPVRGSIERVVLSSNVKSINSDAFAYCTNLKEIVWPEALVDIFDCAFKGCINLKEITLPDTVSYLGEAAFANCHQLEKVTLSKRLHTICGGVFYDCVALNEIRFTGGIPDIYRKIETGSSDLKVYYPRSHRDWDDERVSALKLLFQDDAVFVGEGERPAMPVPTPTEPKPTDPVPTEPTPTEPPVTVPPTTVPPTTVLPTTVPPVTTVPSEPTVPATTVPVTDPTTQPTQAPTTQQGGTEAPTTAPGTEQPQPGGEEDLRAILPGILIAGALILLGGGAAAWFFVLRKRK